jgi:ferredoxin
VLERAFGRKSSAKIMTVVVDLSICDLHGLCVADAPDVFEIGDDGVLHIPDETPPERLRSKVQAAVRACPAGAITLDE